MKITYVALLGLSTIIIGVLFLYLNQTIEIDQPALSPDGKYVIFTMSSNKHSAVYRLAVGSDGKPERLSPPEWESADAVYSEDGKRIAFVSSQHGENGKLYLMTENGSDIKQISNLAGISFHPAFSRQGDRIFFLHSSRHSESLNRPTGIDLYSVTSEGSDVKKHTDMNCLAMSGPSLSANDNKILLQSFCPKGKTPWWLIDPDNNQRTQMKLPPLSTSQGDVIRCDDESCGSSPKFSSDGKKILFLERDDLYVVETGSNSVIKVFGQQDVFPADIYFSLDASKIVFTASRDPQHRNISTELWMTDLNGHATRLYKP